MKGIKDLMAALRAGYPYFYCQTGEMEKTIEIIKTAIPELVKKLKDEGKDPVNYHTEVWNFEFQNDKGESEMSDPNQVLNLLENVSDNRDLVQVGRVLIAKNFNWFLKDDYGNPEKVMTSFLQNRAEKFTKRAYRKILIIVSDEPFDKAIPDCLKREFKAVEFPMPDDEEIEEIYNSILKAVEGRNGFVKPSEEEKLNIISSSKGLTRSEITKALAFSLVQNEGRMDAKTVADLRAAEISNTPGLKIGIYNNQDELLGFDRARDFVGKWINRPDAKGVIFIGPAGTGKTRFVQKTASRYNKLVIDVEFAQMSGEGLVGQMENAYAKAIEVIKANANPANPIIVFCDEVEKGLSGVSKAGSSESNDGGTSERSAAQFLKFLSDERPEGIYVMATCNDMTKLPAAYIRSGRWDCIFYVDFPNELEREAILNYYKGKYNIKKGAPKDMVNWTGAEIENWCRQASVMGIEEADEYIIPIITTAKEEIEYLQREWKPRAVPATRPLKKKEKKSERTIDI